MKESSKLDVIIVSSNYNDLLKITLPNNLKYIKKEQITIVTTSLDTECHRICNEFGVNYIISDRMFESDTKIFNRSKAINDGVGSLKNPDYVLLLDADICVESEIDTENLSPLYLYSPNGRYIYLNQESYKNKIPKKFEKNNWYGYFQLFNINNSLIDKYNLFNESFNQGIGKEDEWFRDKFKNNLKIIDVNVSHLGDVNMENWAGRTSEEFK